MTRQKNIFGQLRTVCENCGHLKDRHITISTTGQGEFRQDCNAGYGTDKECGCKNWK